MGSKLISTGCSFTEHDYRAGEDKVPVDFLFWDHHMADYLNLDLHNYAVGGSGWDEHIYQLSCAIAEHGEDIEAIIIGGSQWDRFAYPYSNGYEHIVPPVVQRFQQHEYQGFQNIVTHNWQKILKSCILSTFAHMFTAIQMAENIKAKILICQVLGPWSLLEKHGIVLHAKDYFNIMYDTVYETTELNHTFRALENDKRLGGFPFWDKLGGEYIWNPDVMTKYGKKYKELLIGGHQVKETWQVDENGIAWAGINRYQQGNKVRQTIDSHPNALGQLFIFERIKEYWNEVYK